MRQLTIIFTLFTISNLTNAQSDSVKTVQNIQEFGGSYSIDEGIGMFYKLGNESAVWRISGSLNSENETSFDDIERSSLNLKASTGLEIRGKLSDDFEYRIGPDIVLGVNKNNIVQGISDSTATQLRYGLGLTMGFNYVYKKLVLGLEVQPLLAQTRTKYELQIEDEDEIDIAPTEGTIFGWNSGGAKITIAYRLHGQSKQKKVSQLTPPVKGSKFPRSKITR